MCWARVPCRTDVGHSAAAVVVRSLVLGFAMERGKRSRSLCLQRISREAVPLSSPDHTDASAFVVVVCSPAGGEIAQVKLRHGDLVRALREEIQNNTAACHQDGLVHFDLVFGANILQNDLSVDEAGLYNGSTVHMCRRRIIQILASFSDHTARLFNYPGGDVRDFRAGPLNLRASYTGMEHIAISKDGKRFAASYLEDSRLIAFEVQSGSVLQAWTDFYSKASFARGGSHLLAASGSDVKLLSIDTGFARTVATLEDDEAFCALFNADESELLIAGFDSCQTVDAKNASILQTFRHPVDSGAISSAEFSADERLVVTACGTGLAHLFDKSTGALVGCFGEACPMGVQFETDNHAVISSDSTKILATCAKNPRAKLYDIASCATLRTFEHEDRVNSVSFSPDGKFILTASSDGTCRLFDALHGDALQTFRKKRFGRRRPLAALWSVFMPLQ